MKKKSTSQPAPARLSLFTRRSLVRRPVGEGGARRAVALCEGGFFYLRVLIGLFFLLAGVFLTLVSFGTFSSVFAQNNQGGTTREQMTLTLAQAAGVSQPPACVPSQPRMFTDVPASNPFCPWIEELVRRGITGGCTATQYCPSASVSRAQMAPFLLKATAGGGGVVITEPRNTAVGDQALFSNMGQDNTATGFQALFSNTDGNQNTATGVNALRSNQTGDRNTAVGTNALYWNTQSNNTAVGDSALYSNTTGQQNTALGYGALFSNSTSGGNTAIGVSALASTTGPANTALGAGALLQSTTGGGNTAIGAGALHNLTAGSGNIAVGIQAGFNVTLAGNVIAIGTDGEDVSQSCYIGNISGADATGGDPVFVTSKGKLGTVNPPSSGRFKDDIKPMNDASEAILALKPVTFRYKEELDPKRIPQFGLVAEEVEKVNPDLVKRDRDGKLQTVRYDAVNAMLLNEFLKAHRKMEEQQKQIDALTAQLKEQAALIQKVSDKIEMSKTAARMVKSDP